MHTGMIKSNARYDKIEKKKKIEEEEANEYEISIGFDFEKSSRYSCVEI